MRMTTQTGVQLRPEHSGHPKPNRRQHGDACSPSPDSLRPDADRTADTASFHQNGSGVSNRLLHAPTEVDIGNMEHDDRNFQNRRDSRNVTAPNSPPHGQGDSQKPSLPPLKTILGNGIASPPRTPPDLEPCGQISPLEPSIIPAAYKPPALYPNKKPRMEPRRGSEPEAFAVNSNSPRCGTIALSTDRFNNGADLPVPFSASNVSTSDAHASFLRPHPDIKSLPLLPLTGRRVLGESDDQFADHSRLERPPDWRRSQNGRALHPKRADIHDTAGCTQLSSGTEQSLSSQAPQDIHLPSRHSSLDFADRSLCFLSAGQRVSKASFHFDDGPSVSLNSKRHYRNPAVFHGFEELPLLRQSSSPNRNEVVSAPFFMPSQYDYQNGKTRKRSNLPKQSTEIMKTWFDQNISNPYPSEEQKAVFSKATGISITQVSNWFINHRRRCPELRDKREKNRNGCEGPT